MVNLLLALLVAAAPQSDAAKAGMQREMGKALFKEGKLDEAIARFQAAVVLNPADAVAWYNLAYASRKAKKFDQAADAYQRYLKLAPDDPDGYFGLAESLRQSAKPALAIDAYRTYIGKESRASEQKWVDQAKDRITELEKPDAGVVIEPVVLTQPAPDPTPHLKRGDAAFAAKDFRTALFAYQDAILTSPKNAEALSKAGQAYAKLGHDQEAIDAWTKALELDPNNAPAKEGLAAARERRAAQGGALPPPPSLTTAPVTDAAARAHYTRAVSLIRDRSYDEAAAELDQALTLKPGFAIALVARGSARIGQGRFQEAIADYSAAQKSDPALAAPLFGLAEAYRALGQNERAIDLYKKYAASDAPDAQPALKDYALQNAQSLTR